MGEGRSHAEVWRAVLQYQRLVTEEDEASHADLLPVWRWMEYALPRTFVNYPGYGDDLYSDMAVARYRGWRTASMEKIAREAEEMGFTLHRWKTLGPRTLGQEWPEILRYLVAYADDLVAVRPLMGLNFDSPTMPWASAVIRFLGIAFTKNKVFS